MAALNGVQSGVRPLADQKNYNPNGGFGHDVAEGERLPYAGEIIDVRKNESGGAVSAWHVLLV